jgi:hypothetical protein
MSTKSSQNGGYLQVLDRRLETFSSQHAHTTVIHYTITDSLGVNRDSHGLEALDQYILPLCKKMANVEKVNSWQFLYLTYVAPSGISVQTCVHRNHGR